MQIRTPAFGCPLPPRSTHPVRNCKGKKCRRGAWLGLADEGEEEKTCRLQSTAPVPVVVNHSSCLLTSKVPYSVDLGVVSEAWRADSHVLWGLASPKSESGKKWKNGTKAPPPLETR